MTWFADLSSCSYFGQAGQLSAVGWLARGHAFTTGEVSLELFEKLCQLLVNPWNPAYPAGSHACELCRFTGGTGAAQFWYRLVGVGPQRAYEDGAGTARFGSFTVSSTSSACLFVPGDGVIYVAPSSVAHYVDAHSYQPPAEFCDAVLSCPAMRSTEYFKALLANGGRELVKGTIA